MPTRDALPSTARLDAVLAALADALLVTDAGGIIRMVNPELCRLLGLEASDLLGTAAESLFSVGAEALPLRDPRLAALRKAGSMRNLDVILRGKAGAEVPVTASCSVIGAPDGDLEGIVILLRDMRDVQRLMAEIARAATAERERAVELADSLRRLHRAQDQLLQSGKMAAIGTLVAGLSHELNNPIAVILGYTQLLLKRAQDGDRAHQALETIERQAKRCGQLVKSLKDFTRGESEAMAPIQPAEMLARVQALLRSEERRRKARLLVSLTPDLPEIEVAAADLEAALIHLIRNALEATPAGGEVVLSATAAPREGRRGLELKILDSGAGIPADLMPRVFDPFFTTKEVGDGMGLGLTVARHLIEAQGGTLHLESHPRKGTVCSVWLPQRSERK